MLVILLLANPHLMEGAQTRQYASANPTAKLPLHHIPRRKDPHPRARVQSLQLLLQAIIDPVYQRRAAYDDDVGE